MEPSAALDKLRAICSRQEKCPADITGTLNVGMLRRITMQSFSKN